MQNLTQLGHDYVKLDTVLIRLRKNQFQHQVGWGTRQCETRLKES